MNRTQYQKPPGWWSPKLSPAWLRFWRPFRKRYRLRKHRLMEVETRGLEHVREAVEKGHGVLITPNHSNHADSFALYEAADRLGFPFYFPFLEGRRPGTTWSVERAAWGEGGGESGRSTPHGSRLTYQRIGTLHASRLPPHVPPGRAGLHLPGGTDYPHQRDRRVSAGLLGDTEEYRGPGNTDQSRRPLGEYLQLRARQAVLEMAAKLALPGADPRRAADYRARRRRTGPPGRGPFGKKRTE